MLNRYSLSLCFIFSHYLFSQQPIIDLNIYFKEPVNGINNPNIKCKSVVASLLQHIVNAQQNPYSSFHKVRFLEYRDNQILTIKNVYSLTLNHYQLIDHNTWIIFSSLIKTELINSNPENQACIVLGTNDLQIATALRLQAGMAMMQEISQKTSQFYKN